MLMSHRLCWNLEFSTFLNHKCINSFQHSTLSPFNFDWSGDSGFQRDFAKAHILCAQILYVISNMRIIYYSHPHSKRFKCARKREETRNIHELSNTWIHCSNTNKEILEIIPIFVNMINIKSILITHTEWIGCDVWPGGILQIRWFTIGWTVQLGVITISTGFGLLIRKVRTTLASQFMPSAARKCFSKSLW